MKPSKLHIAIKTALASAFGERLSGVVLFGSEARGAAQVDSDVDVFVLLDGPPNEPDDSWACIDALYPLVLEYGRPIHAEPVGEATFHAGEYPLHRSAAREGVHL